MRVAVKGNVSQLVDVASFLIEQQIEFNFSGANRIVTGKQDQMIGEYVHREVDRKVPAGNVKVID
jgi:hypothetical protein